MRTSGRIRRRQKGRGAFHSNSTVASTQDKASEHAGVATQLEPQVKQDYNLQTDGRATEFRRE